MGFESLLGNQRLKDNLTASLRQGKNAHFYLISGPAGAGKGKLARLLSAAVMCQGQEKPCLRCSHCRKVLDGVHPDVIFVTDPEHKTVPVRLIRQMRDDVFVRPNEGSHKVYIFPQEMGVEGQNALLKILEEPPKYGVFLLLTDNPDKLLPTVRSRCTELKMQALSEDILRKQLRHDFPGASEEDLSAAIYRSGGFLGQAKLLLEGGSETPPQTQQLVEALCRKDSLLLTQTLTPMEKWKRDALLEILKSWLEILENAILSRSGIRVLSPQARQLAQLRPAAELHEIALTLKKAIDYTQSNVSPAAVCGWLTWELR